MNTTCASNTLPDAGYAGVPDGVFAGLMPYDGPTAMEAMKICCETEDVNVGNPNNCTLWCELPDSIMEQAEQNNEVDMGALMEAFTSCIKRHDPPLNRTGPWIRGVSAAPSTSGLPSLAQLGIAALGVALAMQLV